MRRQRLKTVINNSSKHHTAVSVTGEASLQLENFTGSAVDARWADITINQNHGNWTGGLFGSPDNVDVVLGNTSPGPWFWDNTNFGGAGKVKQYIDTTIPTTLQKHDVPWTFSAWITRDSTDPPPPGDLCYVSTRGRATTKGWSLRNLNQPANPLPLDFDVFNSTGNGTLFDVLPTYSDDAWYFHTVTWTPGDPGTLTGYVNGVQHFTGTLTLAQQWTTPSTEPDRLGAANYSMWGGYFDTMRVYNRVLSSGEILRDYYAGKPAHP